MVMSFFSIEHDNGEVTCNACTWNESGDDSIGVGSGCTNDALYDENGELIPDMNDLILDCISNPRHCKLFQSKYLKRR